MRSTSRVARVRPDSQGAARAGVLLLGLVACTGKSASTVEDSDVTAEASAVITTVVNVTWKTSEDVPSAIEFGPDESYGTQTPLDDGGTDHTATLLGLEAASTYHFRVVSTVDGERQEGEDHLVGTGRLPTGVPDITPLDGDGSWDGFVALSFIDTTSPYSGALILDAEGKVVWYWLPVVGSSPFADLTLDKRGIILRADARDQPDVATVQTVSFDGTDVNEVSTPYGHHSLAQVPGLQFAYLKEDVQEWDGEQVAGDDLVELDTDGNERVVWSSWDHLTPYRHSGWDSTPPYGDWTHANGLYYDADDDTYLLSLYWLQTVFKIDRATGNVIWTLGGDASDFTFDATGAFGKSHAPEATEAGIILFDNDCDGGSAAREFSLDETTMTASEVWRYQHPDGRSAIVLGDADRLADGTTLIAMGDIGEGRAVTADGTLRFGFSAPPGVVIGQVARVETFYP